VDELQRMGCESAATMRDEKSDVGAVKEEEQFAMSEDVVRWLEGLLAPYPSHVRDDDMSS
jgi:hypothetical protein